ncbi:MAG: hypothetical protein AAF488_07945 [Planctomycetota bacterium]
MGCQEGVHFFAKDRSPDGGHGVLQNMIVWNNVSNLIVDDRSSAVVSFSNIGGDVLPGEGNISTDPMFFDIDAGDFRLNAGSPCIDSGFEGADMGAIQTDEPPPPPPGVEFIRSDANENGSVDISDAITILAFLFQGRLAPNCMDAADADDDGLVNITDPIVILQFLFVAGDLPPAPYPDPGLDPTPDELPCVAP